MTRIQLMLCAATALSLAAPAALRAAPADDTTTVATVNGQAITLGEMRVLAANIGPQAAGLPAPALWDMVLDQITRQVAVSQQAEAHLSPRDQAGLALQRRAYLASLALEKVAAPDPTEAELHAAYDKAFGNAGQATEYNASHILVETEDAAKAAEADLAAGKDFGAVAEARSTGPSGPNKGELGWFTLDMMVKPFADAVAGLEKGAVSKPVQTQFGWHVIRLNDQRTKTPPKFDEVRPELAQTVRRERVEADIARVLDAAKVEKVEGLAPDLLQAED